MSINYRNYFKESSFSLLLVGSSNWDYYEMTPQNGSPLVVALAKPGSGASDCAFGSMKYFQRYLKSDTL